MSPWSALKISDKPAVLSHGTVSTAEPAKTAPGFHFALGCELASLPANECADGLTEAGRPVSTTRAVYTSSLSELTRSLPLCLCLLICKMRTEIMPSWRVRHEA